MKKYEIQNTFLDDFLLRIDEREKKVFVTAGTSDDGWGDLIAWNPVETFVPKSAKPDGVVRELEDFAKRQQFLGRIVGGYESYDFGCLLHEVKIKPGANKNIPMLAAHSYDSWIRFNEGSATVFYKDDNFRTSVDEILSRAKRSTDGRLYSSSFTPANSRDWYNESFNKIKNYINSGDVYQVNLTHPLNGKTENDGRDLYTKLRTTSESDFQSYLEIDDFEIISLSPERFIQINGRDIKTSPIKGTRPRGKNEIEDQELRADLENNPKDMAELNMITDLLRNDLGKVCKVGSVNVLETRSLKSYPTLWHAHSTIEGVLEEGVSPVVALSSMMPGGSITGCPKKRAIEIIEELEPQNRGLYTGSIFIIDENGNLDSSIVIRTIIKNGQDISLSVGGGIVNDSILEDEYEESINKAKSFMESDNNITSSDVLESQFGQTEIEILYQDQFTRLISTRAVDSKKILEISFVDFAPDGIHAYPEIHNEIIAGESIGKAFIEHQVSFYRDVKNIFEAVLPDQIQKQFGNSASSTVIEVIVRVGPNQIPYAKILETYSADVKWELKKDEIPMEYLHRIEKLCKFIR